MPIPSTQSTSATHKAIAVAAAALVLLAAWPARGQSGSARYRFTTVLDSAHGLVPTSCPAINTLGTVAVVADDPALGIEKLLIKREGADAPVVVADTGRVANFPAFCDNGFSQITSNPSINELGEVAFQGNLRRLSTAPECGTPEQRHTPRQAVYLGEGGPLTAIAHSTNPPGNDFISEFLVADTSVNSSGKVALSIEVREPQFDQGLFVGSRTGAFDERFRRSTSESVFRPPSDPRGNGNVREDGCALFSGSTRSCSRRRLR